MNESLSCPYYSYQRFFMKKPWDLIQGELVTFTDPHRDLTSIDRLEGFRPGGHSM
jgi:hypothetical protein